MKTITIQISVFIVGSNDLKADSHSKRHSRVSRAAPTSRPMGNSSFHHESPPKIALSDEARMTKTLSR